MDELELLKSAVRAAPSDRTAAGALFDKLQERGRSARKAREEVNGTIREGNPEHWPLTLLRPLVRGTTLADLRAQLAIANGKRKARTLDLGDVLRCIKKARAFNGASWVGGGTVANAYKYPAEQTACVAAVRSDGTIRVAIGVCSASKGASLTNWATGLNVRADIAQFRTWADQTLPVASLTEPV